ncbi:MAG: hypothetical protein WC451_06415 [Patescibacteria group bacterium]|jgi:hypothetical protein
MDVRDLVTALLRGETLTARQWVQDSVREGFKWGEVSAPTGLSDREMVVAAALTDLFADRANVSRPGWTFNIGAAEGPIWLVRNDLPRFADRVKGEVPEALRSKRVFAPANFLLFA